MTGYSVGEGATGFTPIRVILQLPGKKIDGGLTFSYSESVPADQHHEQNPSAC